jgi:hypothetical protein
MKKSIKVQRKKRGRPATGKDPLLTVRAPKAIIQAIEDWAAKNAVTRSEAVRRLVELGLTVRAKPKQAPHARSARAKELASKAIDKLTVGVPHDDEKVSRKRRLTRGPEEFREDRVDLPKAKGK